MRACNVPKRILRLAARQADVRIDIRLPKSGRGLLFRLKTHGPTSDGKPVRWGRVSTFRKHGRHTRVPGRVCWHGHRAFFQALFRLYPEAEVQTALTWYVGKKHFQARLPNVRRKWGYMGSYEQPMCCDCKDAKVEQLAARLRGEHVA